jgi:hypothetical protein
MRSVEGPFKNNGAAAAPSISKDVNGAFCRLNALKQRLLAPLRGGRPAVCRQVRSCERLLRRL